MKHAIEAGLGFGLTSGIITSLGLMIGLSTGTESKDAIVIALVTVAVADGLSDALGIHVSYEANEGSSSRAVWVASFFAFLSKLVFTLSFLIPVLLLPLQTAVWAGIIWGMTAVGLYCIRIAHHEKRSALPVILQHEILTVVVIVISFGLGELMHSLIEK